MAKLTFTSDFADSPYRVAYSIADRAYAVVEMATGAARNWFERGEYQAAYAEAAGLNTESAETDDTVYCEECGHEVNPAEAVLDGELMVCPGCAPCSAAEFEAMQMAEADRLMAAEMAALVPDPETWAYVSTVPCEPVAPIGAVSSISRAEFFDALCLSVDELRDYWRDVPRRLKAINEAWEVVVLAEAFYFNAQGDLLVPSGSKPGVVYAVGHSCPCTAGRWGNHCRHSIVADIIGRAVRIARLKAA